MDGLQGRHALEGLALHRDLILVAEDDGGDLGIVIEYAVRDRGDEIGVLIAGPAGKPQDRAGVLAVDPRDLRHDVLRIGVVQLVVEHIVVVQRGISLIRDGVGPLFGVHQGLGNDLLTADDGLDRIRPGAHRIAADRIDPALRIFHKAGVRHAGILVCLDLRVGVRALRPVGSQQADFHIADPDLLRSQGFLGSLLHGCLGRGGNGRRFDCQLSADGRARFGGCHGEVLRIIVFVGKDLLPVLDDGMQLDAAVEGVGQNRQRIAVVQSDGNGLQCGAPLEFMRVDRIHRGVDGNGFQAGAALEGTASQRTIHRAVERKALQRAAVAEHIRAGAQVAAGQGDGCQAVVIGEHLLSQGSDGAVPADPGQVLAAVERIVADGERRRIAECDGADHAALDVIGLAVVVVGIKGARGDPDHGEFALPVLNRGGNHQVAVAAVIFIQAGDLRGLFLLVHGIREHAVGAGHGFGGDKAQPQGGAGLILDPAARIPVVEPDIHIIAGGDIVQLRDREAVGIVGIAVIVHIIAAGSAEVDRAADRVIVHVGAQIALRQEIRLQGKFFLSLFKIDPIRRVRHVQHDGLAVGEGDGQGLVGGERHFAGEQEILLPHVHAGGAVVHDQAADLLHFHQMPIGERHFLYVHYIQQGVAVHDLHLRDQIAQQDLAAALDGIIHAVVVEVHGVL